MPNRKHDGWQAYFSELTVALAASDDVYLIRNFLLSLLTPSEIQGISNRWALVRLIDGGMSQRNISKELGLSLCKITRGSKELQRENSPFASMINLYKQVGET